MTGHTLTHRPHSAAASPQPELERARLTRQIRHGLPLMVQLETGRRLEPSLLSVLGPSLPGYLLNSRPESGAWIHRRSGSMPPQAQPCMVMVMDALSVCLSSRTALLGSEVGWMEGHPVPKRHPPVVATNACSDRYFSLTQCCY